MRIAVLNYSGNVGKTTIARDLLKYRMPDYEVISIETVNSDGKESLVIRGQDGDKIYTDEKMTLDIGSSNLESFINSSEKEDEILDIIDMFIIPIPTEKKQQADSLKTMQDLLIMGVKPQQIRIIFNQVDDEVNPKDIFSNIIAAATKLDIPINLDNLIFRHDLYNEGQSLAEMISTTDYKAKMQEAKEAGQESKAREYAIRYVRQRKLASLNGRYATIFENIMS